MDEYFLLYPSNRERFDTRINSRIKATSKKTKDTTEKDKTRFQEFVYLYDEEYDKLKLCIHENKLKNLIGRLNDYIGSTGKKYKSHYYTIINRSKKAGVFCSHVIEEKEQEFVAINPITEEQKQELKRKMQALRK